MATTPHGLTERDERRGAHIRRDTRPLTYRLTSALRTPIGLVTAGTAVVMAVIMLPAFAHIAPGVAIVLALWSSGGKKQRHLPLRLPISAGRKTTDYGNPMPGHRGYRKAAGIIYAGNDVERGMAELWHTADDALTHDLILGTTGAGKTVSLTGQAANYISLGGGLIYTDAKAAKDLPWTLWAIALRCGRADDFLVVNYMTGNRTIGRLGGERMTNTANPFAHGSADDLVQILSSLIPTPEGDNAVFGERALTMLNAELYALVCLRDEGYLDLGVGIIRDYLPLEKLESLLDHPGLKRDTAKTALRGYLHSLPNWKPPKDRQQKDRRTGRPVLDESGQPVLDPPHEEANRQHGFAQMYFTRALSSLTDTYGHIYQGTQGEVDFIDVVRRRRILATLLPALEKSPAELANLGKINLSAVKSAIGSSLGSSLEGTRREVLESLPTSSPIPSKIINDEYGYMSVDGFAIVAAQARGLGFSVTFAGQDWAGIQRGGQGEADQVWSNTRTKYFGKLLDQDGFDRLQKAAGEAYTTETSGYEMRGENVQYADSLSAQVQLRSRVNITDLQAQNEGEAHVLADGTLIRGVFFYPAVNAPDALYINRYLRVGERTRLEGADDDTASPAQSSTTDSGSKGTSAGITRHVKQQPLPDMVDGEPRDMGVAIGESKTGQQWRKDHPEATRQLRPRSGHRDDGANPTTTKRHPGDASKAARHAPTAPTAPSTLEPAPPLAGPTAADADSTPQPDKADTTNPTPADPRPRRGFGATLTGVLDKMADSDDTDADDTLDTEAVDVPAGAVIHPEPQQAGATKAATGEPLATPESALAPAQPERDALEQAFADDLATLRADPDNGPGEPEQPASNAKRHVRTPAGATAADRDADQVSLAHTPDPELLAENMTLEETFVFDTVDTNLLDALTRAVIDDYPTEEMQTALSNLTADNVRAELEDALTTLLQGTSNSGQAPMR